MKMNSALAGLAQPTTKKKSTSAGKKAVATKKKPAPADGAALANLTQILNK